MGFKIFREKHSQDFEPLATITKAGSLYLNVICMRKYLTREHKYVNIYFDAEKKTIGIRPIEKPQYYSYAIRQIENHFGARIHTVTFFKYHKIPYGKTTRKHPVTWNKRYGLIEIKLLKGE